MSKTDKVARILQIGHEIKDLLEESKTLRAGLAALFEGEPLDKDDPGKFVMPHPVKEGVTLTVKVYESVDGKDFNVITEEFLDSEAVGTEESLSGPKDNE